MLLLILINFVGEYHIQTMVAVKTPGGQRVQSISGNQIDKLTTHNQGGRIKLIKPLVHNIH